VRVGYETGPKSVYGSTGIPIQKPDSDLYSDPDSYPDQHCDPDCRLDSNLDYTERKCADTIGTVPVP